VKRFSEGAKFMTFVVMDYKVQFYKSFCIIHRL